MQTDRMTPEDIAGMVHGFNAFYTDVLCKVWPQATHEERIELAQQVAGSPVALDLLHKHAVALKLKIG